MIILLGETAAAREISQRLKGRRLKFLRLPSWSEKTDLPNPTLIIDASHPSLSVKFSLLRQWCVQQDIPYLRLDRPETAIPASPLIFTVSEWEEALLQLDRRINVLFPKKGRPVTVFVTTGSHQLESILSCSFMTSARLVVRVLPQGHLVQKCQDIGIDPRDIVAMQGPFSKEINKALFKFYGTDILLTRDSGQAGGTDTKISAALELGLEIIMVKKAKPKNTGLIVNHVDELFNWIDGNFLSNILD
jgi:precorrin-6A/cobalt-precorrin-6A reductase